MSEKKALLWSKKKVLLWALTFEIDRLHLSACNALSIFFFIAQKLIFFLKKQLTENVDACTSVLATRYKKAQSAVEYDASSDLE